MSGDMMQTNMESRFNDADTQSINHTYQHQIDSSVDVSSKTRTVVLSMYMIGVLLIVSSLNIGIWRWGLITIALFGFAGVELLHRKFFKLRKLCHISTTTPKNSLGDWLTEWQLRYLKTSDSNISSISSNNSLHYNAHQMRQNPYELWQAKLEQATDLGWCIYLKFAVTIPMNHIRHEVIWQDQVPADTWRQLKVLARWSS